MKVSVQHTLGDMERDMRTVVKTARRDMVRVVRENTREGNRLAKAFASEQHTMFGDEDAEYPPSFTWEMIGPLTGEFGADAAIGDGSQSTGYEFGSINSPGHFDHARAQEAIRQEFFLDVEDLPRTWFWPGAR